MIKPADVKDFVFKNRLIVFMYLFSTFFFLYQHTTGISWDFATYVLNAKYIFGNGFYFELLRPPLAQTLLGLFSVFGWLAAEYVYIIFVSTFYLFSCIKVSETINVDKRMFYALSMNPLLLVFGLSVGTELLTLAFLQMFVSRVLKKDGLKSGMYAGLNSLLRYTNFIYLPVILFTKNLKTILKFSLVFILLFLPWLWFSFVFSGNPLTAIADSYALSVKYRVDNSGGFNIYDLILAANYLLPLFLLGIWFKIRKGALDKKDWIMLTIIILTFISYYRIPIKHPRYFFNLILPLAYFSIIFLKKFKVKAEHIGLVNLILGISLVWLIMVTPQGEIPDLTLPYPPYHPNLTENCMISSNRWVILDYLGKPAEPAPRDFRVKEYVDKGYRIIIYKDPEPDYSRNTTFLKQFPVMEESEKYVILGNESLCLPPYTFDKIYLEQLNESIYLKYNYSIETDPCKILLPGFICPS